MPQMSKAKLVRMILTPIILLSLLGGVWYAAQWGWQNFQTPIPKKQIPCVKIDVGSKLTPERVTVRVFNGGAPGGSAKLVAMYLRSHGFPAPKYTNTEESIAETVVIGSSADDPEVKLVTGFFPGAIVRPDGREDHIVDVLIGTKYRRAEKPATSVPVKGPVCLPPYGATASPTTSEDDEDDELIAEEEETAKSKEKE